MISSDLSKVLQATWNEDIFKKAFDMEIQGARMQEQTRKQIYSSPQQVWIGTTGTTSNPFSYRERVARQRELMQRLAIAQRKGKPSYRQRQKNGRAGRK